MIETIRGGTTVSILDERDSLGAVDTFITQGDEQGLRVYAARLMQQILDIQSQIRSAHATEVRDSQWLARAQSAEKYRLIAHNRAKSWLSDCSKARNRADNERQRDVALERRRSRLEEHAKRQHDQNNRVAAAAFSLRNAIHNAGSVGILDTCAAKRMEELIAVMDSVVAENTAGVV